MSSEQHLQRRRQILQENYDLLAQKLKELRHDCTIEAGTAIRFHLKKQIEQFDAELNNLAQELNELEQALSSGRVYRALLKLGYQTQTGAFRQFIQANSVAAFLIHGSLWYGQGWLLNRLVSKYVTKNVNAKRVVINLSRIARRSDVAALWRELSYGVGLGWQSLESEIIERVYKWSRTQTILLIFDNVNHLSETFLQEMILKFWFPLVTKARGTTRQTNQFQLFMFLVDNEGCVDSWNISFAEQLNSDWEPDIPVKLPAITEFSEDELVTWINYEAEELPIDLTTKPDETVRILLQNSDNGIPEPTLQEICRLSDCEWKHTWFNPNP
ncbi:MAG: hypothetical protein RMY28_029220 [Nostoc sp. ChiSLP01]|nr:hypothetical protein [Nostoc sp. CmiSLP01]MDZ8286995.1 hypothetical protein [Nostoc sp. ChiSLP01]